MKIKINVLTRNCSKSNKKENKTEKITENTKVIEIITRIKIKIAKEYFFGKCFCKP